MDELREKAETTYEEGCDELFRPDGSPKFSEAEQAERLEALRAERHRALSAVEWEADEGTAKAREEISSLENRDLTALLTAEELAAAGARKPFVEGEVAALDHAGLLGRLKSVEQSGDRPGAFAHLVAAKKRAAAIVEQRREELANAGRPLRAVTRPADLDRTIKSLETELFGEANEGDLARARERLRSFEEASSLAWSLKRGGRNPAQAYLNRKYSVGA